MTERTEGPRPTVLSWSSGKDSAWTLHRLRADPRFELIGLFTTVLEPAREVTMHGVPRELLRAQADCAGLPLFEVALPDPCTEEEYAGVMAAAVADVKRAGARVVAFGDLFLEDLRERRERNMEGTGLATVFPLWKTPTAELAREMVDGGLSATIVSIDTNALDESWLGRRFDGELLDALPDGIDPCGENGEFHTFVHAAPGFDGEIAFETGEVSRGPGWARLELRAV